MKNRLKPHYAKPCYCNEPLFIAVEQNLAYSPGQMRQLQEKGIPISSQTVDSDFYDGDTDGILHLEAARIRGYNIIDAWNDEKAAKSKIYNAHKVDSETFSTSE